MAYFPDLSPYSYLGHEPNVTLLNVGWLDEEHDYPIGNVAAEVLDKLFNACLVPIRQTRGWHSCQLCRPTNLRGYRAEWKGRQAFLGSAEIRVRGRDGIEFASPNLIFHYVRDHRYLPPQAFLDALRWSL